MTLWTVAHQAPLSMGFSGQESWSVLPGPPPENHPDPGIEPATPVSPELQVDSLPSESSKKPILFSGFKFLEVRAASFSSMCPWKAYKFLLH